MAKNLINGKNIISTFVELGNSNSFNSALKFGNSELNYAELNFEVERIASLLLSKGLNQYDFIGINLTRSLETVISILAVLKIGAAYIPLDPTYPKERLNYIISDAGIKAIITESTISNNAESIITINLDKIEIGDLIGANAEIKLEDTAYIIYTSGSTGKPKGVEVTHNNLFNFVRLAQKSLGTNSSDICLGTASINYALSVRQIFVPLTIGAKLVFSSNEELQDPEKLLLLIKKEKITQIDLVPSHLRSLIFYLLSLDDQKKNDVLSNNLKRIVTVGEPLSAELLELWYNKLNQVVPIINIFGQTETTGIICYNKTNPTDQLTGIVPIGNAIDETDLYILDENLNTVTEGMEGELCISNSCVAKGYFNRPELTKEKFIENKFNIDSEYKIYRTGDLIVKRNNLIYYIGRKDSQVKIRGMRVEIGEIEYAINEIDFVEQSIVIPIKQDIDIRLVAFIKSSNVNSGETKTTLIKSILAKKIPAHMMPSEFVFIDNFPLNPNGKIDRLKLSEFITPQKDVVEEKNATKVELKLLELWQKILRKKNFSINDDFFSIGGDSLSAVNLFIEIEKEFNKHLPISVLYTAPTISNLAEIITNEKNLKDHLKSLVPIRKAGSKTPLFFVHGAGGNILLYRDLVKYIDNEVPFYGLQSIGLDGIENKLETIEEMAIRYLEEIKTIHPQGPYLIGGYCMGGTIAIEIAQLLTKQGEEVKAVFLLETYNWCALPSRSSLDKYYYAYQKIVFHFNNLFILNWAEKKLFLSNKWNELKNRKNIWFAEFSSSLSTDKNRINNQDKILADIWEQNDKAAFKYQSKEYKGEVFQFLPKQRYKIHSTNKADWEKIIPNVKVTNLPVYAAGMLVEPFVRLLGHEINKILKVKNT